MSMIFRPDIGRDRIFDFRIYHNQQRRRGKNVGKCERYLADSEHASSDMQIDRPVCQPSKANKLVIANENLLIQIFDNQSSDGNVGSYRSRSIFAFFRADQDKRDDTKFYSLFSTISARAIPGCVCGRMKCLQGVSKLIAKSYRTQQRAQRRKSWGNECSGSNNKWKRLISMKR